MGVHAHRCMVCGLDLKDAEPCQTLPVYVIPGCSKCLFMYEVGEIARVALR